MTLDLLQRLDIRVSLIPMEGRLQGETIELSNGYLILIRESLTDEAKWTAFLHEMTHILEKHFGRPALVEEIEDEANAIDPAARYTTVLFEAAS